MTSRISNARLLKWFHVKEKGEKKITDIIYFLLLSFVTKNIITLTHLIGKIQLPFSIVLLIFGPALGFIISKLGTIKPLLLGSLLTTFGFAGLFIFHSDVLHISINLAILSSGLSFASVGAMNVIILATPREYSGVTIGVSSLLRITGASMGPVLASIYMEINQIALRINGSYTYFPSPSLFDFIFFTAIILSIISLLFSILVSRKIMKISIPNLN